MILTLERDRQTDRQTDRAREREREREGGGGGEEGGKETDRETETDRQTERQRDSSGMLRTVLSIRHRLIGLVVKASASRADDPGFESRLRRDFFGAESYQ